MPFIVYADIKSLIRKIDGCANNPENSSTTKIGEHIPCGYSMSKTWAFDYIENKHTLFISFKRLYENVFYFIKRTPKKVSLILKRKRCYR